MGSLLVPGSHRCALDDEALIAAMVRAEVGWVRALGACGVIETTTSEALAVTLTERFAIQTSTLVTATEDAGNPVVPLVKAARACIAGPEARWVHRGLTSQDVLDTALMLLARSVLAQIHGDLTRTARDLGIVAQTHRRTVMAGRTLTQHAVPITFGLKAARWLSGVLDAADQVEAALDQLPVQCGGAAGTLALASEFTSQPVALAETWADELGLRWPGVPWHTNRTPVLRVGDALVRCCDALGVIGGEVALLSRPEIDEVREGVAAGRGDSSTMPHKRNPVLSILMRSAAMQAPYLAAALHQAAGASIDERPDGAWHAEWPAFQRLLVLGSVAASQAADLVPGLEVDPGSMATRVGGAAEALVSERGGQGRPEDYLGAADVFIDAVLTRLQGVRDVG